MNGPGLLFPPRCPFCRRFLRRGEGEFCAACAAKLPRTGAGAVLPGAGALRSITSPLYYAGSVRESLLRFKFRGRFSYARAFGALMAESLPEQKEWDAICFVPVSRKRRRQRGYDQAALLAGQLARRTGLPLVRALKKPVDNRPQSSLRSREERAENAAGAYRVTKNVRGLRLLLADDIYTTGSTMAECAKTLLRAGAESVDGISLARRP